MIFITAYLYIFLLINTIFNRLYISSLKQRKNIESFICLILLIIFFGFRGLPVLNDTAHYYEHFRDLIFENGFLQKGIIYIDENERFEPGYQLFERILGHLTNEPYMVIFISSLIFTISFIYYIRKFTYRISLTIFIMLLSITALISMYSSIRQTFVVCIFFFAYEKLVNHQYFKYYITILIAYFFHSSAIILLILPLFNLIDLNKRNIILVIIAAVISAIFINTIINIIGISDSIYYDQQLKRERIPLSAILNFLTAVLLIIFCWYIKQKYHITENHKMLWWLSILNICFSLLSIAFIILYRYTQYFYPLQIILLIILLLKIPFQKSRTFYISIIITFFFIRFITVLILKNEWFHLYPYSFFEFGKVYYDTNFGY